MIVTEEEAKTKMCQESLMPAIIMASLPASGNWAYGIKNCIGSGCMAWRWHEPSLWEGALDAMTASDQSKWQGYCGKAGA